MTPEGNRKQRRVDGDTTPGNTTPFPPPRPPVARQDDVDDALGEVSQTSPGRGQRILKSAPRAATGLTIGTALGIIVQWAAAKAGIEMDTPVAMAFASILSYLAARLLPGDDPADP